MGRGLSHGNFGGSFSAENLRNLSGNATERSVPVFRISHQTTRLRPLTEPDTRRWQAKPLCHFHDGRPPIRTEQERVVHEDNTCIAAPGQLDEMRFDVGELKDTHENRVDTS